MPDSGALESLAGIDAEGLRDWVEEQRWYASKSRHVTSVEVIEVATLRKAAPRLVIALLQTGFATGTHELYQLPIGMRPTGEDGPGRIAEATGCVAYDALTDPRHGRELLRLIDSQTRVDTDEGQFAFHLANGVLDLPPDVEVRPIGVEQSNSSLVFADELVLKVFRKVEPGLNPELEMLRFLTARGFPNIAPLYGWCEYQGEALVATLLVAQRFLPDGTGGWELALDELAQAPEAFIDRLAALGQVTARMHSVLGSEVSDPAFVPEEPSQESLALLTATLDEDIDRLFSRLPEDPRLDSIRGRGQDVQERLAVLSHVGVGGRMLRTHGDYHLGQTLMTPRGWVILDFEGEPARPLHERRQKRSPLRDVAGMLRSFAYVASAAEMQHGTPAPDGWEERARAAFLDNYLMAVEPNLLPPGEAAVHNLLSVFELEKAVYELRYELDNRPDWVPIPVAGIERILEQA